MTATAEEVPRRTRPKTIPTCMNMHNPAYSCVMQVAILGASGYAGGELVRLLDAHPGFTPTFLGAHNQAGKTLVFPPGVIMVKGSFCTNPSSQR